MINHKILALTIACLGTAQCLLAVASPAQAAAQSPAIVTTPVHFTTHDGYPMEGKLTHAAEGAPRLVVVYVQTAEGMTVDMKRPDGRGGTFNYFDLYRAKLTETRIAFFSYEGRGVRMGASPPRFETIDSAAYNTSTLSNKASDALAAVRAVRAQPGMNGVRVVLMGASEGTLIATEAASLAPKEVQGLVLYGVLAQNMRDNFRYIMTGGAFLNYRIKFDLDGDGKISSDEYTRDPVRYRASVLGSTPFTAFDRNGDGYFTVEDMGYLTRTYLDAIDHSDVVVLDQWASKGASVSTPKGWFKDHFAHPVMWSYLSQLDVPTGMFQGGLDAMVSQDAVKLLEQQAKAAGKTNIEFHYFPRLDHTLDVDLYFVKGTLPKGHEEIFAFINRIAGDAR